MNSRQPGPKRLTAATDWRALHQRIEAAHLAIDGASVPDAGILKERARLLAREPVRAENAGSSEWLEFLLAQETYALESRHVREVHPLENLTPLSCTPDFVLGIVNLRGEILSVIDLKKFFALPERGLTDLNKIIVLESADMRFGILADAILGVRRIPSAEIQPSLPTLTGIREKYLQGVSRERTVLLDAAKLLADRSIVVNEQV